jgi:hypothetical protein
VASERSRTTSSQSRVESTGITSLPQELGIHLRGDDVVYALMTFIEVGNDPAAMATKAPMYRALIERVLPDTEFTRRRLARALQGFEEISRAARVLLTLKDLDLFGEMKNLLIVALKEMEATPRAGGKTPAEIANKHFEEGVAELLERLKNYPDPRVRNSLTVLSKMGRILNLSKPLPALPGTDSIELEKFSLKKSRLRKPRSLRAK